MEAKETNNSILSCQGKISLAYRSSNTSVYTPEQELQPLSQEEILASLSQYPQELLPEELLARSLEQLYKRLKKGAFSSPIEANHIYLMVFPFFHDGHPYTNQQIASGEYFYELSPQQELYQGGLFVSPGPYDQLIPPTVRDDLKVTISGTNGKEISQSYNTYINAYNNLRKLLSLPAFKADKHYISESTANLPFIKLPKFLS